MRWPAHPTNRVERQSSRSSPLPTLGTIMSRETRISDKINKTIRSRQNFSALFRELKKSRAPRAARTYEPEPVVSEPDAAQRLKERLRDREEHERALDNLFPHRAARRRRKKMLL
jgi:hypothetical protein